MGKCIILNEEKHKIILKTSRSQISNKLIALLQLGRHFRKYALINWFRTVNSYKTLWEKIAGNNWLTWQHLLGTMHENLNNSLEIRKKDFLPEQVPRCAFFIMCIAMFLVLKQRASCWACELRAWEAEAEHSPDIERQPVLHSEFQTSLGQSQDLF